MRKFTVGKLYRFTDPSGSREFYRDIESAFYQVGGNCYFCTEAAVVFLGTEKMGHEPYNKWLHGDQIVYINFCDDLFK